MRKYVFRQFWISSRIVYQSSVTSWSPSWQSASGCDLKRIPFGRPPYELPAEVGRNEVGAWPSFKMHSSKIPRWIYLSSDFMIHWFGSDHGSKELVPLVHIVSKSLKWLYLQKEHSITEAGLAPVWRNRLRYSQSRGVPWLLSGQESAYNVGDTGDLSWEDPPEEGMATHSGILAWKIPKERRA